MKYLPRTRCVLPVCFVLFTGLALMGDVPVAQAQQAPVSVVTERSVPSEEGEILARTVSMDVDRVSIVHAIDALAKAADVSVTYKQDVVLAAAPRVVTLHVHRVALREAFLRLLEGTNLEVVAFRSGRLAVIPSPGTAGASGGIAGVVTDAKTQRPLRGVSVALDDSSTTVHTGADGRFRFANVTAGQHHIVVRYVGYGRQMKLVTVTDDQLVTVTIALEASVNTLDQVVITATGEQRVRELGHVVAQINADSLVKQAPISDIGELLQSRIPGLRVLTANGGIAGGPVALQLRGQTSLNLNSEPIVVVDGVRFKSNNLIESVNGVTVDVQGGGQPSSPLNDLNPNDIETVEVVKGPSASTLYGPDASNGVIVITTKRGKAGKTEWNWYAHPVSTTVPESRILQSGYQIWSHNPNDPSRTPLTYNCDIPSQYYHYCMLDSITSTPTFFSQPDVAFIGKNKPTWQYGLNVAGGSTVFRYYLSGNYDSQLGSIQVPTVVEDLLKAQLGVPSLSDAIRNPNSLRNLGTHASVAAQPSPRLTLNATVDYHQVTQHRIDPSVFSPYATTLLPPGATSDSLTASDLNGFFNSYVALTTTEAHTNRLTGSLQASVQPASWLSANAQVGLDLDGSVSHTALPGATVNPSDGGTVRDDRRDNVGRTVTLGATAATPAGRVTFRTSVGVQYIYQNLDGLTARGSNLAPGSTSIATATQLDATPQWSQVVTLGTYGQETIGFGNRLFLDAGLRLDGSTRYGDAYHPAPLPKLGVSWIASDEPLLKDHLPGISELRFRGSYGSATRYPTSGMILGTLGSAKRTFGGQTYNTFSRTFLANPSLRPERSREFEYGADITSFLQSHVQLTWYHRRTNDELNQLANPTGLGPIWRNVADVSQDGFEAALDVPVVNLPMVEADLSFGYSYTTSKVLSTGDSTQFAYRGLHAGYPIDAIFGPDVTWHDTVGNQADGIILPQELTIGPNRYLGVSGPPRVYTLTPTMTLLRGRVHVSSVFERQAGSKLTDDFTFQCKNLATCTAPFLTTTAPALQAKYLAGYSTEFLFPGDFTRWRELNLSVDVPTQWLRIDVLHLRFSHASISLQGRDLKLWTKFPGTDPESPQAQSSLIQDIAGIPQARSWAFRFDVTP